MAILYELRNSIRPRDFELEKNGEIVKKAFYSVIDKVNHPSEIKIRWNSIEISVEDFKFILKRKFLRRGVAIFDNGVEREKCEFKIEVLCDLMEFAVDVRTSLLQKYPSEGCLKNFFALSNSYNGKNLSKNLNFPSVPPFEIEFYKGIVSKLKDILNEEEDVIVVSRVEELKSNYEELVSNGVIKLPTVITRVEIGGKIAFVDEKGNVYERLGES